MLTIEITDNLSSLMEDTSTWDSLATGMPFRQAAWLGPWWECFGQDSRASVVVARDDQNEIMGLLPLYRRLNHRNGSNTLSMIGDGDACSDYVSVLTLPQNAVEVATAMGRYLGAHASDDQHGWDLIDIDGVVEGDVAMGALATGLKEAGASLHASSRMSVWFKPADSSWEEHLKHHGKTQRRKMRRMVEKLDPDHDSDKSDGLQKVVAANEDELSSLLHAVIELHQKRWEADGESGSFADPRFKEFMRASCRRFLAQGQLHLVGLRKDEQVIAGELSFIGKDNRVLYAYSSGYDIDFADLQPGRLLCVDSLHELYQSDLAGIDFMRGDEAYKIRYATESKKLYRVRAVAPTLMPRLRHAVWSTGFEVKQWMRRRTGRPEILVQDPTTI